MKRTPIVFLSLLLVGFTIAGCRRQPETQTQPTNEEATQQETNRFLTEQGITLPEGAERAYLSGQEGNRGVATREEMQNGYEYNVVASLPELNEGHYDAWVKNAENQYKILGTMRADKGGYVVSSTLRQDGLNAYTTVVVSRETGRTDKPSSELMTGSFSGQ